jgi:cyclic pyranopterin phosphate synthase
VRALDNLASLGIRYRSNTVVTGMNYDRLEPLAALLVAKGVRTVNFILFNPIVEQDANREHLNVEYSKAAPHLKGIIDRWGSQIERLTVRYIPLCLMQGYEQYVTNMPQLQYDSDEWDYLVRTRVREGAVVSSVALGLGLLMLPDYGRAIRAGWQTTKRDAIKRFLQHKNKVKPAQCATCKYDHICDGVWREYARWRGTDELVAIRGTKIRDPKHFRPDALNARGLAPGPAGLAGAGVSTSP